MTLIKHKTDRIKRLLAKIKKQEESKKHPYRELMKSAFSDIYKED